ncbi:MAG TPA: hypothetical protein V6C76_01750 [Drouetiella sp.]
MVSQTQADSAAATQRLSEQERALQRSNRSGLSKRKTISAFVISLLAFGAINTITAQSEYGKPNPKLTPYRGWSWWTTHDIRNSTAPSNVVLLGSSLMVAAIAECDANYVQHSLDLSTYRGATYLDSVLQQRFNSSFSTLNLSAPGQMPSDAYLTLKAAIDEGVKPQILIYGVAPRDFLDGTMQSPSDTEAFKYLSRSVDINNYGLDFFSTPFGKLEWLLRQNLNLYKVSIDCRIRFERFARHLFTHNGLCDLPDHEGAAGPFAAKLRALYRPFNIEPGTFLALQTIHDNSPLIDNTRDYRDRYRNPDHGLYQTQFRFLDRIAKLCADNKIKLVVIEMPITKRNVEILKPHVYQQYKTDLAASCRDNGVPLLNLCQFDKYSPVDYRDTVHLNGFGGKKFVDNLVPALATVDSDLPILNQPRPLTADTEK